MNIKVGQYGRLKVTNKFIKITGVKFNKILYEDVYYCYDNNLITASTPQELIQKGDLVKTILEDGTFEVEGYTGGGRLILIGGEITCPIEITKILTPHGKDFICQWERDLDE